MEGGQMENKESELLLKMVNLLGLVTVSSRARKSFFYAK